MAKFDGESTYCNVPVHFDDRYLLSMKWRGNSFIDLDYVLPRSSFLLLQTLICEVYLTLPR